MFGGAVDHWGTSPAERVMPLPGDDLLPGGVWLHRAVDVDAPPALVFRWLCQLRAAPYSYDWIDNVGRRSPQELTPGLERLATGQTVARVFTLAQFEPDRSITIAWRSRRRPFGEVAITYAVLADGAGARLLMRVRYVPPGRGRVARAAEAVLSPGDLVMARRQLRTFKRLAERDARRTASAARA